ncbi:MAG: hypothetical protein LBE62_01345 [Azonexus sp.]|jgi:regulator of protease activity HflC (stomatin/prohibitin superfamily)|nr:hypothetical protein [Azonexus sp.]
MNQQRQEAVIANIKSRGRSYGIIAIFFIAAIVVLTTLSGSWYTVDQSERGVVLRNGAFVGEAEPGLGFKIPVIDNVVKISLQTLKAEFPQVPAYSMDQQPANLNVSVTWKVDPGRVKEAYADFKGIEGLLNRVINPQTNKQLKSVFGQFTAYRSISERAKFNADFDIALRDSVKEFPVIIESVQIENIDYSTAYEQSVEQRMLAEVEVQKLEQNARREKIQADIRETQADGEARAVVQQAEAEAKAIKLKGDAEAYAIRERAKALAENAKLVQLVQAEKWDGRLPQTMLPTGSIPILDMREREK